MSVEINLISLKQFTRLVYPYLCEFSHNSTKHSEAITRMIWVRTRTYIRSILKMCIICVLLNTILIYQSYCWWNQIGLNTLLVVNALPQSQADLEGLVAYAPSRTVYGIYNSAPSQLWGPMQSKSHTQSSCVCDFEHNHII